jgi:hypothetical protein
MLAMTPYRVGGGPSKKRFAAARDDSPGFQAAWTLRATLTIEHSRFDMSTNLLYTIDYVLSTMDYSKWREFATARLLRPRASRAEGLFIMPWG